MPNKLRFRSELESEITQCVLRVMKEVIGRGPQDARTYLVDQLVFIRCKIPLLPSERSLLQTSSLDSLVTIREWRRKLNEKCCEFLRVELKNTLQVELLATLSDNCPINEETIFAFTLQDKPNMRSPDSQENLSEV